MSKLYKAIIAFTSAFLIAFSSNAQEAQAAPTETSLSDVQIMVWITVIGFAVVCFLLLIFLGRLSRRHFIEKGRKVPAYIDLFGIFDGDIKGWSGHNKDVLMEGHEYDGIREYDNDLPPWWKYLFYVTIGFAVIYLAHYHVFKTGESQEEEYLSASLEHKARFPEVDAVYDAPLTTEAELSSGKEIFLAKCKVCHGENAEGLSGPNLTDEYWIPDSRWDYKGGINHIFRSIKHGRNRGMQAWKSEMGDDDILSVSSYIMSLEGTKPEGAKEPEGEKYEPESK